MFECPACWSLSQHNTGQELGYILDSSPVYHVVSHMNGCVITTIGRVCMAALLVRVFLKIMTIFHINPYAFLPQGRCFLFSFTQQDKNVGTDLSTSFSFLPPSAFVRHSESSIFEIYLAPSSNPESTNFERTQ